MPQPDPRGKTTRSASVAKSTSRSNVARPTTSSTKAPTRSLQRGGDTASRTRPTGSSPAAPAEKKNKTMMYVGIGAGAVVLLVLIALAMSGPETGGGAGAGEADAEIRKIIKECLALEDRKQADEALAKVEAGVRKTSLKKSKLYPQMEEKAKMLRRALELRVEGTRKIEDFARKVEDAKKAGTAMARSGALLDECKQLEVEFSDAPNYVTLKDLKSDLVRWAATEGQSGWQKAFNPERQMIDEKYFKKGEFAQALRAWNQFKEQHNDPIFKQKVEEEITKLNLESKRAAEKIVAEVSGEGGRTRLEEALPHFNGTDGHAIIKAKMNTLK